MPKCPLHLAEDLEPKRKGWFCEECGAIVLGYDSIPPPEGMELPKSKPPDQPDSPRAKAHSLPCPASDGTPTHPVPRSQPEMLRRDGVTRWAIVGAAARSTRETLRTLSSTRLPSTIHVDRGGVEAVVWTCLARPRRGLLIVGPPGMGKTALLTRVVERALGSDGPHGEQDHELSLSHEDDPRDAVLFLSGRSAYEVDTAKNGPARLCDAILRCADVHPGEFDSLEQFVLRIAQTEGKDPKPRRRVWLVLDGIDEARASEELLEALDAFLPVLETHAWVRLVVSMRTSTYDALAARGAEHTNGPCGAFVSERWWTWFEESSTTADTPFLELPGLDDDDARSVYQLRQGTMAHRACKVPFDDLAPSLRRVLRVPLYQHLFHDAFRGGKAPPPGLDETALVDAFLDSLTEEVAGLDRTLSRLGKAMLRRRRPDLPLELGDQWKAEWTSQRAERHVKTRPLSLLDPVSELVSASGLMVPDEVGHGHERGPVAWRFVHERVGEQVLLRELLAAIAPRTVPTGEEILGWAKTAAGSEREAPFGMLLGALEVLLRQLVAKGESSFVSHLLDIEDRTTRTRLVGALLLALADHWEEEDETRGAARALDALTHAAMLRNRAQRLLAAAWQPLSQLCAARPSPTARALHRGLFEVARSAFGGQHAPGERLAYSTTLLALAEVARTNTDADDARRYLEDAVRQLTDAAVRKGANDAIRSALAAAHRGIARVEHGRKGLRRARKALETALRVSSTTDDESQPLPAGQHQERLLSLLLMGDVLRDASAPQEAAQAYEEALRASVAALAETPYRSDLRGHRAAALAGLAHVAVALGQPDVAAERYRSALDVLRKLTRREPQRTSYQLLLVDTLDHLATLNRTAAESQDACQLWEESAAIMLALVHAYPREKAWRSRLVRTLAGLGVLMRQIGEDEPARACLEDALRHGRKLEDDDQARRSTASALLSLVQLDEIEGRRFEAHKHVDEALDVLSALARGPDRAVERRCLALALLAQGRQEAEDGDQDAANGHLNRAVHTLSELVAAHPGDMALQADLGAAINGLRYLGAGGRVRRIPKHTFSALVTERDGVEIREYFDREEITIGRAPGNDLMLPNYSVSRHHATVRYEDGSFKVEDLGSKLGTVVSGKRVDGHTTFQAGERVELGDFVLVFEGPVDTSYGAQWSSMMAETPTGYPPPVQESVPLAKELLLLGALSQGAVPNLDATDVIDPEE
jgi:tetratricopeptide (TPR) repeat protein